jgi:hypothetical protein
LVCQCLWTYVWVICFLVLPRQSVEKMSVYLCLRIRHLSICVYVSGIYSSVTFLKHFKEVVGFWNMKYKGIYCGLCIFWLSFIAIFFGWKFFVVCRH